MPPDCGPAGQQQLLSNRHQAIAVLIFDVQQKNSGA
jgi:hypothetical protein